MSKQNTPKKEQGSVPNEQPTPAYQLTKLELKRRLKHIAGLCYSLVCDLSNVEIEAEQLRAENEYLRRKLGKIDAGKKRKLISPEERERRAVRQKEIAKERVERREQAAQTKHEETPEEREKRLEHRRKKYAAETPEQRERRLAYMREYMRKRNAEKKAQNAAQSGEDGKPKADA